MDGWSTGLNPKPERFRQHQKPLEHATKSIHHRRFPMLGRFNKKASNPWKNIGNGFLKIGLE